MPAGVVGLAESTAAPRVVLVTGAGRHLGSRLCARLAADPSIEQVLGIDTEPAPAEASAVLGRTEFIRADVRNPLLAKVIASAGVDTVVHLQVASTPGLAGGREAMKQINIVGTMQLLAACQQAPAVRRLVVGSTTAVYGSSPRDPALFTEDAEPRLSRRSGYAKDAVEVEGFARGFGRRRPDVALSLLRFTNVIGADAANPLTRYFSLPVIPTVLGFDPRLQLCHDEDAVEAVRRCTLADHPGTYNVGGHGVLLLSQAVRRLGAPSFAVPAPLVPLVARGFRRAGLVDFSSEQLRYLEYGQVADVSRLGQRLGWSPRPTAEAFEDFAAGRPAAGLVTRQRAAAAEQRALKLLTRREGREFSGA